MDSMLNQHSATQAPGASGTDPSAIISSEFSWKPNKSGCSENDKRADRISDRSTSPSDIAPSIPISCEIPCSRTNADTSVSLPSDKTRVHGQTPHSESPSHAHEQPYSTEPSKLSQLPQEALLLIFTHLYWDCPPQTPHNLSGLLNLSLTCKAWRSLICTQPRFWRYCKLNLVSPYVVQKVSLFANRCVSKAASPSYCEDGGVRLQTAATGLHTLVLLFNVNWTAEHPLQTLADTVLAQWRKIVNIMSAPGVMDELKVLQVLISGQTSTLHMLMLQYILRQVLPAVAGSAPSRGGVFHKVKDVRIHLPNVRGFPLSGRFLQWFSSPSIEALSLRAAQPFFHRYATRPEPFHGRRPPDGLPPTASRETRLRFQEAWRKFRMQYNAHQHDTKEFCSQLVQDSVCDWSTFDTPLPDVDENSYGTHCGVPVSAASTRTLHFRKLHLAGCFIHPLLSLPQAGLPDLQELVVDRCKWGRGLLSFLGSTPALETLIIHDMIRDEDEILDLQNIVPSCAAPTLMVSSTKFAKVPLEATDIHRPNGAIENSSCSEPAGVLDENHYHSESTHRGLETAVTTIDNVSPVAEAIGTRQSRQTERSIGSPSSVAIQSNVSPTLDTDALVYDLGEDTIDLDGRSVSAYPAVTIYSASAVTDDSASHGTGHSSTDIDSGSETLSDFIGNEEQELGETSAELNEDQTSDDMLFEYPAYLTIPPDIADARIVTQRSTRIGDPSQTTCKWRIDVTKQPYGVLTTKPMISTFFSSYEWNELNLRRDAFLAMVETQKTHTTRLAQLQKAEWCRIPDVVSLLQLHTLVISGQTPPLWTSVDDSGMRTYEMNSSRKKPCPLLIAPYLQTACVSDSAYLDDQITPPCTSAVLEVSAEYYRELAACCSNGAVTERLKIVLKDDEWDEEFIQDVMSRAGPNPFEPNDEDLLVEMREVYNQHYKGNMKELQQYRRWRRAEFGWVRPKSQLLTPKFWNYVNANFISTPPLPCAFAALGCESRQITYLNLSKSSVGNETFRDGIRYFVHLKILVLFSTPDLTDECLCDLPTTCPRLQELDISGKTGLTAHGVAPLIHRYRNSSADNRGLTRIRVNDPALFVRCDARWRYEFCAYQYLEWLSLLVDADREAWDKARSTGGAFSTKHMKRRMFDN